MKNKLDCTEKGAYEIVANLNNTYHFVNNNGNIANGEYKQSFWPKIWKENLLVIKFHRELKFAL